MNLDEKLARLDELFGSYKAEWLNEKIFHFLPLLVILHP